ncbi:hypothetical protein [Tropicimonas sp. IMCC6043]|uniref:hypothetical protein n=1 Tax=Tropicimonas sp. IMCC6043 TaxID=2510645 RepID=UPI00101DE39E|nr:hypothetical protein [Tropicimonas sp. IMCC6043]RYH12336.1 hypothetical protein EU800_01895 [Tropicimonas sp. IMCC6043]
MEAIRNAARFLAHRAREAALYPQLLRRRSGRTLLLFPCMGREMSSLLRVYEIADGLAARGWTAVVVPKQLDMAQRQRLLRLFRPDICLL